VSGMRLGAPRRQKRLWRNWTGLLTELEITRRAAPPTLKGHDDISCSDFLSLWYIAKSDGPTKLLPWPTAEGNLATGRTASRAEKRATWPANQRLERMAKKGRLVFPRLVSEGWLKVDELADIGTEKVDVINKIDVAS